MDRSEPAPAELFEIARSLAYGRRSKPRPRFQEAARLWKRAARCGHARAMFYLGVLYVSGDGVRHYYLNDARKPMPSGLSGC